jgi:hypothetical protein
MMKTFLLKFTNGRETRHLVPAQQYPDEIYAMMAAERYAPLVFRQHWNKVPDTTRWEMAVHSADGSVVLRQPFSVANTR